jgi:hypothetical protein
MRKREVGIAILSFGILAAIMVVILVFTIVIYRILDILDVSMVTSFMMYILLGASIGISAGFGYIVAQRLFDALLDTKPVNVAPVKESAEQ